LNVNILNCLFLQISKINFTTTAAKGMEAASFFSAKILYESLSVGKKKKRYSGQPDPRNGKSGCEGFALILFKKISTFSKLKQVRICQSNEIV
jgi:hypothetical protein